MSVLLVTSGGEIVIDLMTEQCPITCKNFLKLCKIKYFNGCLFHTVQKDFIAQTGDPTGTGYGGDSVYKLLYGDQGRFFGDEIHTNVTHAKRGTVAMASAGENLNASQFYITLRDDVEYLDGKHTVFGEVAEGLETLARINEAHVDENSRPYKNIRIKHTYVLDDPFEDPSGLSEFVPEGSPVGKPIDEVDDGVVRLEDDWVPMDERLSEEEVNEILRAKEARSSAVVLESIGDIPDADVKPPENVLFVCKLNPATKDDDLEIIFGRFGSVTSCEIIRDQQTGQSLCFGFIEFGKKSECEEAYIKMNDVLIDDRRVCVDFSQSVSKLWSRYRPKQRDQAVAHIAKDCHGNSASRRKPSKYVLKDRDIQRGGDGINAVCEMVFDEHAGDANPRHKKKRRHDKVERDSTRADRYDIENWDGRTKDSADRSKRNDRNKGQREHGRRRELSAC